MTDSKEFILVHVDLDAFSSTKFWSRSVFGKITYSSAAGLGWEMADPCSLELVDKVLFSTWISQIHGKDEDPESALFSFCLDLIRMRSEVSGLMQFISGYWIPVALRELIEKSEHYPNASVRLVLRSTNNDPEFINNMKQCLKLSSVDVLHTDSEYENALFDEKNAEPVAYSLLGYFFRAKSASCVFLINDEIAYYKEMCRQLILICGSTDWWYIRSTPSMKFAWIHPIRSALDKTYLINRVSEFVGPVLPECNKTIPERMRLYKCPLFVGCTLLFGVTVLMKVLKHFGMLPIVQHNNRLQI